MLVASWNVNSLRVRLEHVLRWVDEHKPDVLGLQETKAPNEAFPRAELESAGYQVIYNGQKTYNGVALLSRGHAHDVVTDLATLEDPQRRLIGATIDGVRIYNIYVPNGQSVGSDKFRYKLEWLKALRQQLSAEMGKRRKLLVMGDFNIAPQDRDVHDPKGWEGNVLVSKDERDALAGICSLGLADSFRLFEQPEASYSWWDYRFANFDRDRGLRIDLLLASSDLRKACIASDIDKTPRGWERPSDHAPVTATFELQGT